MVVVFGFGGVVVKYMGVYKYFFRIDRVFLWVGIGFILIV